MLTGCELLQIQNNKMQPDRQNELYHDRDIAENMSTYAAGGKSNKRKKF